MALNRETTGGSADANNVAAQKLSIVVPLYNEAPTVVDLKLRGLAAS